MSSFLQYSPMVKKKMEYRWYEQWYHFFTTNFIVCMLQCCRWLTRRDDISYKLFEFSLFIVFTQRRFHKYLVTNELITSTTLSYLFLTNFLDILNVLKILYTVSDVNIIIKSIMIITASILIAFVNKMPKTQEKVKSSVFGSTDWLLCG